MRAHVWLALSLGAASLGAALAGCNEPAPLSVHDLVADARHNNGEVVTVEGCYEREWAISYLNECESPSPEFTVWVEDYEFAKATAASVPDAAKHPLLQPAKLSEREADREKRLLEQGKGGPVHVVLIGQFQEAPQAFGPAGLDWRLIVHKVVSCDGCELER